MLPKRGRVFPSATTAQPFPKAVAAALKNELGNTHQAVKIIRKWTGAGERTVKNWLAGTSGPSGQHLVDLIRYSDGVLEVLMLRADRQQLLIGQKLLDARNTLERTLERIDALIKDDGEA